MMDRQYSFRLRPATVYERLPDGGEAVYLLQPEGSRIVATDVRVRQPRPHGVGARDLRSLRPTAAAAAFGDHLRERMVHSPDNEPSAFLREAAAAMGWPEEAVAAIERDAVEHDPWRSVLNRIRRGELPARGAGVGCGRGRERRPTGLASA